MDRARLPWLDREEFAQIRALAEVEGNDPDEAVRAFLRQEHRYYDLVAVQVFPWTVPCDVPLKIDAKPRTPEGMRSRQDRSRQWWRDHGAEYRAKRRAEGRPLLGGKAYRKRRMHEESSAPSPADSE